MPDEHCHFATVGRTRAAQQRARFFHEEKRGSERGTKTRPGTKRNRGRGVARIHLNGEEADFESDRAFPIVSITPTKATINK